ncbi:TPA: hypothetical protein ACVO4S_001850 [Vibrio diabolicus]
MSKNLAQKKQQAQTVKRQIAMILNSYELSDADKDKMSKDIADVILTSWDLTLSDLSFGDTWFKEDRKNSEKI